MYLFSFYCLVASNADAARTHAAGRGAQPPLNAFRPRPLCASNYNLILRHNSINKQCGCSLTEQRTFAKVVISFNKSKRKPVDGFCVINCLSNSTILQRVLFEKPYCLSYFQIETFSGFILVRVATLHYFRVSC